MIFSEVTATVKEVARGVIKFVSERESAEMFVASGGAVTVTAISWFNLVNAAMTSIILVLTVIFTWRKLRSQKAQKRMPRKRYEPEEGGWTDLGPS